ncbi:hypothetical protein CBR_g3976 [Chara braunii]|uniref:Uncharacterized protein n=1 Tax=Chara braunii TaxID=69332 RepID=A0A388KH06_CHABU|nr:hypothetical protein CBR_g3976 [Chara braunii]|eukprot:GBG69277.1 hypothetical protein CBR_g3976 [Chara braunii]
MAVQTSGDGSLAIVELLKRADYQWKTVHWNEVQCLRSFSGRDRHAFTKTEKLPRTTTTFPRQCWPSTM